jgi:hypothetical protein
LTLKKVNRRRKLVLSPVNNTYLLTASDEEGFSQLLQLRILGLGIFQDGNIGLGVFPELRKA